MFRGVRERTCVFITQISSTVFTISYQYLLSNDGTNCDESRTSIATLRARRRERTSKDGTADTCSVSVLIQFDRIQDFHPAAAAYRNTVDTDVVCVVSEGERRIDLTAARHKGDNVPGKHCLNIFVESLLNTYPRPSSVFQTHF